jgi:hypothetical protein
VKRLLLACLAVASACAQAPEESIVASATPEPEPEQIVTDHEACGYYPAIFVSPPIARQGAELALRISEPVGAYAPRPIPAELLTGWKATPAGQVNLARDGSKLTVLPTAMPGTDVTISASFCGKRDITRIIRIVGKDEPVLTGAWREQSKACTGETPQDPVNELEFKDTGDFSITYFPFESYRDYWGKAEFDAKSGALAMTTTGGNRVPGSADLSGTVTLKDGKTLILEGFFLSQPQTTGGVCTYTFAK